MEMLVLTHFQRNMLAITGLGVVALSLIQVAWMNPAYTLIVGFAGVIMGDVIIFLGMIATSDSPYEPPFLKIRYHKYKVASLQESIDEVGKETQKVVADWKLEIEKRLSRIAELERDKQ